MPETYLDKPLMELTGGDLELILTRALCVAASYGAVRNQAQQCREFWPIQEPVTAEAHANSAAFYNAFLSPLWERMGDTSLISSGELSHSASD